jgi:flagellar biogenesis protein FliO
MSRQKKYTPSAGEKRRLRRQQIFFASLALVMILAMVVSLIRF